MLKIKSVPENGLKMLNLGAGQRSHPQMNNVDYSIFVKIAKRPILKKLLFASGFITPARATLLDQIDKDIVLHDLTKGIPYANETFDVVYHSHLLEHLQKESALIFMQECVAKLKPGGVLRVVVPDLETFTRDYLAATDAALTDPEKIPDHDSKVSDLLQQFVSNETAGTKAQSPGRRMIERLILGDRRKRGDLHQWMYDRVSLPELLKRVGLTDVRLCSHRESRIPQWDDLVLDRNEDGSPYKLRSLYAEGSRPV